jgi:hypothetical protein
LRRVATLVAAEAPELEVFAVATKKVGLLLGAQTSNMVRFTGDWRLLWLEPGTNRTWRACRPVLG